MNYYIIIINIILFILLAFLVLKFKNTNKQQTIGGMLIGTGLGLVSSSFPNLTDKIFIFGVKVLKTEGRYGLNFSLLYKI